MTCAGITYSVKISIAWRSFEYPVQRPNAALVLGIIAIPGALLLPRLFYVVAILAIFFGGIGLSRAKRGTADNGCAIGWGLGLGIAGFVPGIIDFASLF